MATQRLKDFFNTHSTDESFSDSGEGMGLCSTTAMGWFWRTGFLALGFFWESSFKGRIEPLWQVHFKNMLQLNWDCIYNRLYRRLKGDDYNVTDRYMVTVRRWQLNGDGWMVTVEWCWLNGDGWMVTVKWCRLNDELWRLTVKWNDCRNTNDTHSTDDSFSGGGEGVGLRSTTVAEGIVRMGLLGFFRVPIFNGDNTITC